MGLTGQLWLVLLGPIALALALYGIVAHQIRHRILRGEASAELRNHATLVEAALGGAVERGQMGLLAQRLEKLARADRILGIVAFEVGGEAIMQAGPIDEALPALSAMASRALALGDDIEDTTSLQGGPALARTVTLSPGARGTAVVAVVVRDLRYLEALARTTDRGLALTGVALLGMTALIAAFASRVTVGRPAGVIVAGVERVSGGDLDAKVPEEGAAELRHLARAFNAMTNSLADAKMQVERKEAARIAEETARVAVERKLQHAQALAAVGQVAASIGHEIGSPLNVILGRARRAADQPECPASLRGELETIAVQSERISRVVARLLTVARPLSSPGHGSDLAQVVQEALAFLGPECRQRRIQVRFDDPGETARAALDPDRLFQVVFNLCLNAIEAQGEGGQLIVRTRSQGGRSAGARKVAFEVEDHGPGVPPESAEHVFDAFFTSKGAHGGTGLGLAIVSGIVREAGGSAELVPTEHGGACFRVTLPAEVGRQGPILAEVRS
jgi:signal transduction histidine kinase